MKQITKHPVSWKWMKNPLANSIGEAVEVCLTASLLMNAKPVDEVHVMRKIVIDGSNTTGFQRTCIVALNGAINGRRKIYTNRSDIIRGRCS